MEQVNPLSPAAQAVLDAALNSEAFVNRKLSLAPAIAAALRAVADQVVPLEQYLQRRGMRPGGTGALTPGEGAQNQRAATRLRLLAIANELENRPQ